MATSSPGEVPVARGSRDRARALLTPHRLPPNRRLAKRWSMACDRSRSLSRALGQAARQRSAHCKLPAWPSLRSLMLHLFRTMVVGRPKDAACNLVQKREVQEARPPAGARGCPPKLSPFYTPAGVRRILNKWHVIPAPSANCAGVRG